MLFGRRFRVLVSVSAAFPVSATDGEVVYNYRGSIDTANFLGQLFRTISQALNLGSSGSPSNESRKSRFTYIFEGLILTKNEDLASLKCHK